MAVELDLRNYVKKYGKHLLKVIATGEGFRNSEPVITEFESRPYIEYSEDGITVTNIQKGVSEIELYVDERLAKTVQHDPDDIGDVLIDFTDTIVQDEGIYHFYVMVHTDYGDFMSNNTMSTKIFGVSGLYDATVTLTRTDDSEGMTFAIDTTTGQVTSDFPVAIVVASIITPIINTFIFCISLWLFFDSGFATAMSAFVTINFLLEVGVNTILSPTLVYVVRALDKRYHFETELNEH